MNTCADKVSPPSAMQQPLSCTWREWIARPEQEREVDAIVVGSGYGGSVAALRLAEKGHRVLLLERGSEYLPGDFPNDFSGVPKHFRVNIPGRGVPLGRASGLVEISVGQGMVAVTGNGLGGGSLINAGVLMRPDADVFTQDAWPAEIRHGFGPVTGTSWLDQAFTTAEDALGGHTFESPVKDRQLCKTEALFDVAAAIRPDHPGLRITQTKLTVDPDRCTACGDCASGCNVPGAKLTLSTSYLRKALATCRVQIVTQAQVYKFEPGTPNDMDAAGWTSTVFSTDAQHQVLTLREAGTERPDGQPETETGKDPASTIVKVHANILVIAAGALGSTQLLQRSQALAGEALAFSRALGTRLSGNGDSVSINTGERRRVNAMGYGANATLRGMCKSDPRNHHRVVGPTITASLDLRDPGKPLDRRIVLQDGAIPGAIARPFAEMIATAYCVGQLGRWWFKNPQPGAASTTDPLAASKAMTEHTQVFLAMGHDGSPGRLVWLPGLDTSAPVLADPQKLPTYREQQRLFDRLGELGTHVHTPLWQWLPPSMTRLFRGEQPPATVTTVHPLGGCPMGDDPVTSVVNHLGQVWVHEPAQRGRKGRFKMHSAARTASHPNAVEASGETLTAPDLNPPNRPQVYDGLFVLDGAIVPTSLGCNPMLTITALAERAMALMDPAPQRLPFVVAPSSERPHAEFMYEPFDRDVRLGETLRAEGAGLGGQWFQHPDRDRLRLVFTTRLDAANFEHTLTDRDHPMLIKDATLELLRAAPPQQGSASGGTPEVLATYQATEGHFKFLRAHWCSSGIWPTLACALQLLVWIGPIVLGLGLVLLAKLQALCALIHIDLADAAGRVALPIWLLWLPLISLLASALPYPRTLLTYLVLRGWSDWRFKGSHPKPAEPSAWRRVVSVVQFLRQMVHAAERRSMCYQVTLERQTGACEDTRGTFPERVHMTAHKRVAYRASLPEWGRWLGRHTLRLVGLGSAEMAPLRPGFWEQVMDARISVWRGTAHRSRRLAHGTLSMGRDNLFNRAMAQLGQQGDTTSGLMLLAGYPLLLARFAIKTRLLDFRLPNHSNLPVADAASEEDVRIRNGKGGFVIPELHWLPVSRGRSSSDQGTEAVDDLRLRLWRYQRDETSKTTYIQDSTWRGQHVRRARAVLLLHAFGQSGQSFTHQADGSTVGSNLAEAFHEKGFEVWILDSRMSTRSGYAAEPTTVDMQAHHDVPTAVNHILSEIERAEGGGHPLQISAFGQCIGAASLWMALLDGLLSHAPQTTVPNGDPGTPRLSKIACAMFSQVHALAQGSPETRAKTWLPGFLQAVAPRGVIPFAVRGAQDNLLLNFLDRLLSTLPAPATERAHQANEDGLATCKRIRFIEAPLFEHENMHSSTLAQMNRLFGDSNIRLFAQARRFIERGRLVDEDGVNRYVTDDNIRAHLTMPIQLLHGQKNRLFDVQSAIDTDKLLTKLGCGHLAGFPSRLQLVKDHGHLDVLLGTKARDQVFPKLLRFFMRAQKRPVKSPECPNQTLWMVRAPRCGPWVGRVERSGNQAVVRVVFMVDDLHGGNDEQALTTLVLVRQRSRPTGMFRNVGAVPHAFFKVAAMTTDTRKNTTAYQTAWVDVPVTLEPGSQDPLEFQIMTAHKVHRNADNASLSFDPTSTSRRTAPVTPQSKTPFTLRPPASQIQRPQEDTEIDSLLQRNSADVRALELASRLTGMPVEPSMLERIHFSVPRSSVEAVSDGEHTSLRFLVGCCRHPGLDVDTERIQSALPPRHLDPAFALLVGDQIYADATAGLMDPLSPTERYVERYETAFGLQGLGPFLARTPTYMTPDDHEWIDAHPNGAPLLKWSWGDWTTGQNYQVKARELRDWAGEALTSFERSLSWPLSYPNQAARAQAHPFVATAPKRPGWTTHRQGCAQLWIIDSRSWRNRRRPGSADTEVVDPDDFNALLAALSASADNVLHVIVTGSVVLPGLYPNADPANPGASDTWQYAPTQRTRLLQTLVSACPRRFLLVSGDYHVSTAVSLKLNSQTVGASIVAPPIYAPLPYANAAPEHVFMDEAVRLPAGELTQHACEGSATLRGNGMGDVLVERRGDGYTITYTGALKVLETGETIHRNCQITL
ncbi:alkaline phosphatase D family protein [Hydrogenophaga sp.]|uniref:alkaline phosphatase D family protein n=2 Tax=Hydrogenophaga sp. TaxID=1904254 RepID=UPI002735B1B0|nr:GMC oxidoreductase [Hydrogenophaga sp.]